MSSSPTIVVRPSEQIEHVAVLRAHRERVDVDVRIGAERARDHSALRMRLGLLGRELPAFHQLVHERVILGELLHLPVADEIRARVADVAERNRVALDERDRHRRPHPGDGRVGRRLLVDAAVCLLEEGRHACGSGELARVGVLNRGGRELRRDLAGLRTAHSVRDGNSGGATT